MHCFTSGGNHRALESLRVAFPDIHYVIHDVLADGDRVAICT